mmetsp:Transcript_4713/g.9886  ORF Transcript_4713/g.9886 Transcript_4713/m.9886 type:complete len:123 (+) Transcript_4713:181-549(+)
MVGCFQDAPRFCHDSRSSRSFSLSLCLSDVPSRCSTDLDPECEGGLSSSAKPQEPRPKAAWPTIHIMRDQTKVALRIADCNIYLRSHAENVYLLSPRRGQLETRGIDRKAAAKLSSARKLTV